MKVTVACPDVIGAGAIIVPSITTVTAISPLKVATAGLARRSVPTTFGEAVGGIGVCALIVEKACIKAILNRIR
jgi:hypothetical protein